jgi:DNA mismatch repair protein MutS
VCKDCITLEKAVKAWYFLASMTKKFRRLLAVTPRPRAELNIPAISLMWPETIPAAVATSVGWENDLGLDDLIQALAFDKNHQPFIRKTLTALNSDAEVIAWRQSVIADFIRNPNLGEKAAVILPRLAHLRQGTSLLGTRQRNLLLETADRIAELDSYVNIVQDLHDALADSKLDSTALVTLRDHLKVLLADEQFQALRHDLPELRAPLENIRSLTVGINLDVELRPSSATLLAINDHTVGAGFTLLERLIGISDDVDSESGIAPLHHLPRDADQRLLTPLFQDLDRILTQVAQPVARSLNRYVKVGSATLANLENELAFYVGAVRLMQRVSAKGIPFCAPEIAPMQERSIRIDDLTNISLALKQSSPTVPSQVDFDENGRIAILTGPNNGGKTTYLRGVGLAQVMFQAGLLIPARAARISPIDAIMTHFPALENRQEGRLAEESARLHTLFQQVTQYSLVLLNETFSSTSSGEAFYLARDILCGLRAVGVRAIYATHLTELAQQLNEIEATVNGDSKLFSLVAGIRLTDDGQTAPTFQITRSLPLGRSYAQEIARHHGISLEQILAMRAQQNH